MAWEFQIGWLLGALLPAAAFSFLLFYLISLPLRRQERGRFFVDLAETGLNDGLSLERTVIRIADSRDPALGVRFHLLAEYLRGGWEFKNAMEKLPRLLPPELLAMLKAGQEIGDVRKVIPACRKLWHDGKSQVQSSFNYLFLLAFVLIPVIPALFWTHSKWIFPKIAAMFAEFYEGAEAPPSAPPQFLAFAMRLAEVQFGLGLVFYAGALFFIGGPRFSRWLEAGFFIPVTDWFLYHAPWRRKRMERDFWTMFTLLLDAGVPEERALTLAAESTANKVFINRIRPVSLALQEGVKLPDALQRFSGAGEFRWRLANAYHAEKGFFASLSGWIDALDARAFRQEQAIGQIITSALVILNGFMAGCFIVYVFHELTALIEMGVLW